MQESQHDSNDDARIRGNLLPIGLIIVICIAAVGLHVSAYGQLGPIDEAEHLDFINRISSGHLPRYGEKLSVTTRREVACRGIENPGGFSGRVECGAVWTDRELPEGGSAYEAGQPPLYYLPTALVSNVIPIGDDVDAIRLTGALWLAIGAVALYLTLRRFKVAPLYAAVVTLVLALAPPVLYTASTISPDIAVWAFGGVALWVVARLMVVASVRYPHLLLVAALGATGVLIKATAFLIILALALALVLQQTWAGRRKSGLMLGASMVGGAVVGIAAWALVATSVQLKPVTEIEPFLRYQASGLGFTDLFKQPLFTMFSPTAGAFLPAQWRLDWRLGTLIQTAAYIEVGLLLLPVLAKWPSARSRSIGLAYLAAVVVSGPYYVVVFFVATHIIYGADTRFAFGLIPLMAVVLATWVRYQWQRWLLAGALALPMLWYVALVSGAVNATPR